MLNRRSMKMIARYVLGSVLVALSFASLPAWSASDLSEDQIISNLQGIAANAAVINAAVLAQDALAHVGKPPGTPISPAWTALSGFPSLRRNSCGSRSISSSAAPRVCVRPSKQPPASPSSCASPTMP